MIRTTPKIFLLVVFGLFLYQSVHGFEDIVPLEKYRTIKLENDGDDVIINYSYKFFFPSNKEKMFIDGEFITEIKSKQGICVAKIVDQVSDLMLGTEYFSGLKEHRVPYGKNIVGENPTCTISFKASSQDKSKLRSILNCSPSEVAKLLGNPDGSIKQSKDCDYLPSCSAAEYQNGKYEALFYNNMLKWICITEAGIFKKNALQYVGFPSCKPTFADKENKIWQSKETRYPASTGPSIPIEGIRGIYVFPPNPKASPAHKGYILITVETNYNKKY